MCLFFPRQKSVKQLKARLLEFSLTAISTARHFCYKRHIFLQKIPPSVFLNFEHQSEELMYYFSTQSILYKPHNFGCRLQGFQINPTKTQIDLGFLREVQLQNQQLSLKLFFSLMVILCIYLKLDQTLFILNPILFSIQHHQ